MSIRVKTLSAIAAGTLALGLGAGVALADQASGRSLADALADDHAVAADTPSAAFVDVTDGRIALQIPGDWQASTYTDDGVTYLAYWSDFAFTQVVSLENAGTVDDATMTEALMEALLGELGDDSMRLSDQKDRTVDGVLVRDCSWTMTEDGVELQGIATMIFGDTYTGMVISSYMPDPSAAIDVAAQVGEVHASVRPVASEASAPEPAADAATAPAADSSVAGLSFSFVLDDFRYSVGLESASHVTSLSSTPLVALPVTVANLGDEPDKPSRKLLVTVTGPSGAVQDGAIASAGSDSVLNVDTLNPGDGASAVLYVADEGSGLYTVSFDELDDDRDDDAVTFTFQL